MILHPIIDLLKRIVVALPDYAGGGGGGYVRKYTVTTASACTTYAELASMLFGPSYMYCTATWVSTIPNEGVYIPVIFRQKISGYQADNVIRTLHIESSPPDPSANYTNASFAQTMPSGITFDVYVYWE